MNEDDEVNALLARDWEQRLERTRAGGRDRSAYRSAEAYRDAMLLEPLLRGEPTALERWRFSFAGNANRLRAIDAIRTHYAYLGSHVDGLRLDRLAFEEDHARGMRSRGFWIRAASLCVVLLIACAPLVWYKPAQPLRVASATELASRNDSSKSLFVSAPPRGWVKISASWLAETWSSPSGKSVVQLSLVHTGLGLPRYNGLEGTLEEQSCANGAYTDDVWDARGPDGLPGRHEEAVIEWPSGENVKMTSDISGGDFADAGLRNVPAQWAQAICTRAGLAR